MSAQQGGALLLNYGPQGARQSGAALVLSYTPPAAGRRRVSASTRAPWVRPGPVQADTRASMLTAQPVQVESRAPWGRGAPLHAETRQPWGVVTPSASEVRAPWGRYAGRAQAEQRQAWVVGLPRDQWYVSPWGSFSTRLQREYHPRWTGGKPADIDIYSPWGSFARHLLLSAGSGWARSLPRDADRHFPWSRHARYLSPSFPIVTPPNDGSGEPLALLYILPSRFYMAVHSLTAQRLPDLAGLPIFDVSLSADAGSFAWTFSASGPVDLFDALAPSAGLPAQIRITLDGIPFVFLVDSLQREERFGKRGTRISGRSATALLARPYARETARLNAGVATAQQLAESVLDATGATLDWGLTDWLVPAGAWSHTGTPLAALQAIVEAAGGYVQSHRTAATLLARHPYPELPGGMVGGPWNWGGAFAADVELAPDAIITSGIERRDGPDLNGVYVSGTTQGVLALVRRTGTAADKLASLITDPLITAQEAALQRGLAVLGAAGPKHLVQIELPILTGAGQPGVLDVGQLVQVNTASPWRGRVRSVSVNAAMPKARQTVSLERHLEVA